MNWNQDPASAMEYESFLRWAFGLKQGGIHLDTCGDPAEAADADSFTPPNLAGVSGEHFNSFIISAMSNSCKYINVSLFENKISSQG